MQVEAVREVIGLMDELGECLVCQDVPTELVYILALKRRPYQYQVNLCESCLGSIYRHVWLKDHSKDIH